MYNLVNHLRYKNLTPDSFEYIQQNSSVALFYSAHW